MIDHAKDRSVIQTSYVRSLAPLGMTPRYDFGGGGGLPPGFAASPGFGG